MPERLSRRLISTLLALAVVAVFLPARPALASGCSLSGRIYDATTGRGLRAKVLLFKKVTIWDSVGGSGQVWKEVARGDSYSGNWSISRLTTSDLPEIIDSAPELPAGTYRLSFVALESGYHSEVFDNVFENDIWAGRDVVLGAGQSITGLDAALSNGWGKVTGRVTDAQTGAPIVDAEVSVEYWSDYLNDWNVWTSCDTGTDGRFTTGRFPSGEVRIRYFDRTGIHCESYWPGTPREYDAQTVVLAPGQTLDGSIAVERRSTMTGRVTDSRNGAPMCDVEVTAYRYDPLRDSWAWDARSYSAADGSYVLRVNGGGEYRLEYREWSGSHAVADDDFVSFYPGVSAFTEASTLACLGGQKLVGLDASLTSTAGVRLSRVAGSSTSARAAELSRQSFSESSTAGVVLINAGDKAALAAAPALAGTLGGPMLFTWSTSIPSATLAEIRRLGARRVFVVGSTRSVGSGVIAKLRSQGLSVSRISGADGAGTTAAALRKVRSLTGSRFGKRVIVVSSSRPVEVGMASALSYRLKAPIVFAGSTVSASVARALADTGVRSAIVVGPISGVSTAAMKRLGALRISCVRRAGSSAAATAYSLSGYAVSKAWATYETVGIAGNGSIDVADITLAGAYAGRKQGVLLLTSAASVPSQTRTWLGAHASAIQQVRVVGTAERVRSATLVGLSDALY